MSEGWSFGEPERLETMWSNGEPLKEIASSLSKTISQICCKASRMGLPTRDKRRSAWNDEREEHLRKRWAEGASPKVIADELGNGITIASVRGKIKRLNLSGQETNSDKDEPKSRIRITAQNHVLEVFDKPLIELPLDQSPDAVGFFDIKGSQCHYPLNSVEEVGIYDFRFCGSPIAVGFCCSRHAARCFNGFGRVRKPPKRKENDDGTKAHARRAGDGEDRAQQQLELRREAEACGIYLGDRAA